MEKQKPLLSILGPTATGKTDLAFFLAKQVVASKLATGVTLISADSRQVYQGLEILTGADVPDFFIRKKRKLQHSSYDYFQHSALPVQLHGVSILNLNEDWSVAHFCRFASQQIKLSWENDYLPIVVGGTGFYHQQLTTPQESLAIKPNRKIREKAELLSVEELQSWLIKLNSEKFKKLNHSDQNNLRRLTRAIEIEDYLQKHPTHQSQKKLMFIQPDKKFSIGLQPELLILEKNISDRTKHRFSSGAVDEVKHLLSLSIPKSSAIMTTAGVEPLSKYLHQTLTSQQALISWTIQEMQYAKRQLTWFNKHPPDLWLKSEQKIEDLAWQSVIIFLSHLT